MAFHVDVRQAPSGYDRTPQDGIRASAYLGRTGIQVYVRDGKILRALRHPDEVFHPDSLASLKNATVTIGHPSTPDGKVNRKNWRSLAKGNVGSDVRQAEGAYIAGTVFVQDEDAVSDVESGRLKELSCGYDAECDFTPGEWEGRPYDYVQRKIRYNHVALLPEGRGRAGREVALQTDEGEQVSVSYDDTENAVEAVLEQLHADYEAQDMEWVKGLKWSGPEAIPLSAIDFSNQKNWQASRDPEKVGKFAGWMRSGHMKPAILVQPPEGKYMVVDGHHRTLAAQMNDRPLVAYCADVPSVEGPWATFHSEQKHGPSINDPSYTPDMTDKDGNKVVFDAKDFVPRADYDKVCMERDQAVADAKAHKDSADAQLAPEAVTKLVNARAALVSQAKLLHPELVCDSLSDDEVRLQAASKVSILDLKDKPAAYVQAAFDGEVAKAVKAAQKHQDARDVLVRPSAGDATDKVTVARNKMIERHATAFKG